MTATRTPNAPAISLAIRLDDLHGREIIELLKQHLRCMTSVSPPESCHALTVEELRETNVTFWSAWHGAELAGCGALQELDATHGQIKSMRTADAYQRKGVASQILKHLMREAQRRGYHRLSLETGSMEYFEPARRLYWTFGFTYCPPFGSYAQDANSVFMTREL